ncbi:uncharacterized protein METZ01_LOCUS355425 [marine metagenome]|uniref:Uncharacterized protein n=1 Tax=marine metagenome TaxID=408172 RepID=A0A382S0Y8_9ZZZZ
MEATMFRPWGFRFLETDRTTCNAASSSAAPPYPILCARSFLT